MRFLNTILIGLTFTFTALSQDCSQPKERGFKCHDANSKQRFFYEPERGTCLPFYFLGCGGNENSFASFEECNQVCVLKTKTPKKSAEKMKAEQNLTVEVCDLITDAKISEIAQSCGDGMDTPCKMGYVCKEEWCCPSKHTICHLPASSGNEAQAHKHYGRYVYLPGLNNCIRFSYFGKAGNFNNFKTYNECKEYCLPSKGEKKEEKKKDSD